MQSAEQGLAKTAADPAAEDQSAALDILAKVARTISAGRSRRLLVELRTELQARLIAELTEMHEIQASIRETTQAQAPRVAAEVADGPDRGGRPVEERGRAGRSAPSTCSPWSRRPSSASPCRRRSASFSREMRSIEGWLKAGDVAPRTIALETRVEEDLLGHAPGGPPAPPHHTAAAGHAAPLGPEGTRARAQPPGRRAQDGPDAPGAAQRRHGRGRQDPAGHRTALPPALRREVEALEATQDEIRDSLAKIAERLEFPEDNP